MSERSDPRLAQAALAAVPDAILLLDGGGKVIAANAAAGMLLGEGADDAGVIFPRIGDHDSMHLIRSIAAARSSFRVLVRTGQRGSVPVHVNAAELEGGLFALSLRDLSARTRAEALSATLHGIIGTLSRNASPAGAAADLLGALGYAFEARRALMITCEEGERHDWSNPAAVAVDPSERAVEWVRGALHQPAPSSEVLEGEPLPYAIRFGVRAAGATLGCIGLFVEQREGLRGDLLDLLNDVGARVGEFLARVSAERKLRASNAQLASVAHEWRATFDAMSIGIVVTDASLRVTRLNRAAAALCAVPITAIPGRSLDELGKGEPWQTAARLVASAGVEAKSDARVTLGDRHWLVACTRAATWPGGAQPFIVTITDTTELVRLQQTLRRSETMSALGVLIAGVCHEVRNPLFGISATLDAFEAQLGTEAPAREHLATLRSEIQRLGLVMRDLLEYGRPPARQLVAESLGVVVREAVKACTTAAAERGVTVEVSGDDARVRMDAGRVLQALQNLVQNAIEHSPRGGAVRVWTCRDGAQVRCIVDDQGPGFRNADPARLFEPFYSRRKGGTGLGLSIAHRVAEEHQGTLRASDLEGGGARLELTVPVAEAP